MSRTKRSRPVSISKDEAAHLLRIAAAIVGNRADSELLERIAKDALRPASRPSKNLDRDLWTTMDYMLSRDSVKVVAQRWCWKFTASEAKRMRAHCQYIIAGDPSAAWIKVADAHRIQYLKRQAEAANQQ